MGRKPRVWIPFLIAVLFLFGSLSPFLNQREGSVQAELEEETLEEQEVLFGEYIIGPVSGERYLIVKDLSTETVEYVGEEHVFYDLASLMSYEVSLSEGSRYKIDPNLLILIDDSRKQDDVVPIIIEMLAQPSHEISLQVRANHRSSLEELLDERDVIHGIARSRMTEGVPLYERPLESYLIGGELNGLQELNQRIDQKMYEIRKEIMDITTVENAQTQEDLIQDLISKGFHIGYQGQLFNTLSAWVPAWYIETISEREDVGFVHDSIFLYPHLDHSAPSVYADVMWGSGVTGGPWDITVADTGIDKTHPNLHVEWEKVVHDTGQFNPLYDDDPSSTDDFHGHGTHIAGIIHSDDSTYRGVAYGHRDMINAKFGFQTTNLLGGGDWGDCMKVLDWAIRWAGADVVSFSFGGGGTTNGNSGPSRYMDAVIDDLGVPISISAGNDGPSSGTLSIPADAFNALGVAAMNDKNTDGRGDDSIAGFSSRGPSFDGRVKPDVAAPGNGIMSANNNWEGGNDFMTMSGTSMASPHVAASFLLMMDYLNDPSLFPAVYKALMINQAEDWGLAGPDNVTGWGYINLDDTLTYMDYHIEGFLNATIKNRFYRGSFAVDDRATLVWQRHARYVNGSYPFQYWPPNDLDLTMYDYLTRNQLGVSASSLNNIEQLTTSTARTDVLLKVDVFGDVIDGTNKEDFSLALMSNFNEILPPSFTVDVSAPPTVLFGQNFWVFANITNNGDLDAWNANGQLNLPPGLTLMSGSNPTPLGTLSIGATQMVSWELRADATGPQTFSVDGYSFSLGEVFLNNSGDVVVDVLDVELPLILEVRADPNPQEIFGSVNVSAFVNDNTGVAEVWIKITRPDMTPYGNFTMDYDTVTLRYFRMDSYSDLGTYDFTIWAHDISSNWNSSSGSFTMVDTTPPQISNAAVNPSPQEVYGFVNVSADVTDNYLLYDVWIEITDPLSGVTNTTMSKGLLDSYFRDDSYDLLGLYDFVIWANDSLNIWTSYSGQFTIQDTQNPIANAGPDQFDVLIETTVNFDGSLSTDNYQIASHTWTFVDGIPQTLSGATPTYVFANASCYDIVLNVTDTSGNYDTDDMRVCTIERNPPRIENVLADPNPQEIFGAVNVSVDIWDDYGIVGVWIEIVYPDMTSTNSTMTSGTGNSYYYMRFYVDLGLYSFMISTLDVYDNWNATGGSFFIDDWTAPKLNNLGINPPVRQIHGSVNTTIFVTDNHQVDQVLIDITDPDGLTYVNTSMSYYAIALQHFYRDSYHKLGTYNFTIWASDFSGNWNSTEGSFLIHDILPPIFIGIGAVPVPQEVFFEVNISASASDDHMVYEAWAEVTDPNSVTVGNFSMTTGGSPGEFYLLRSYDVIGRYDFVIWISDFVGNWKSMAGFFRMQDGTKPVVIPLQSNPTVEVHDGLNITANATDNYELEEVFIEIRYPSGAFFGNFSMTENPGDAANFYHTRFFTDLGQFTYILTAEDTSGNFNVSYESFTVVDTTPPIADAGDDQEVIQDSNVAFDGEGSSDNYGAITNYNWSFDYDGDKVEIKGEKTLYTFEIPGNYLVTLTVTDSSMNEDTDTVWVNVTPKDSDSDGLTDDEENALGTDPFSSDSDGDGLSDFEEVNPGNDGYVTNPTNSDTDNDGIIDSLDELPTVPSGGDGDADEPIFMKYWWLILLIVLIPLIILPIVAASGRKRKKEEQRVLEERRRRQARRRADLAKSRESLRMDLPPPPPPEGEVLPEPEVLPPPPDEDLPPPPPDE